MIHVVAEHGDDNTRFLYELARNGETSVLVGYLKRADKPLIRRRAAELLGDFGDVPQEHKQEEIIQSLIETVEEDDDNSVRARAIDALYQHGKERLERLINAQAEFDVNERPDWVTAEKLTEWLDADYPEFRMVAATALGEIGDESVVPDLLLSFDDPDPRVRERAVRSCGRLGGDRCVPYIQDRLDDEFVSVQEAAATALGEIGTEAALEALIPVVQSSGNESVRRIAVEELGQFESLKPLVVLVKALEEDSDGVTQAAMLSVLQIVAHAPSDETTEIRETVAGQLDELNEEVVLPPLLDVCRESPRAVIRWHAMWFLGRIPSGYHEAAVECLLDGLDSDETEVADIAADSLTRIDGTTNRLRVFVQKAEGSDDAVARAERVLEELDEDTASEVVTNAVDYTYVREPADYTASSSEDSDGQ